MNSPTQTPELAKPVEQTNAFGGGAPGQRLPFHEAFFQGAHDFALGMFKDIPELEGIAIIPSWKMEQARLPTAIMAGKDGPLQHPGELMRMAIQLHRTLNSHLDKFMPVFKAMDDRAGELATIITQRQQELDALEQQLLVARANAGTDRA